MFCRKRDQTELNEVKMNRLDPKSEELNYKCVSVYSECEDSGNFSIGRTRAWLAEQRQGTVCRYCRDGEKSEENEVESSIHTTASQVDEKDSAKRKTESESESCNFLKNKCSSCHCETNKTEQIC